MIVDLQFLGQTARIAYKRAFSIKMLTLIHSTRLLRTVEREVGAQNASSEPHGAVDEAIAEQHEVEVGSVLDDGARPDERAAARFCVCFLAFGVRGVRPHSVFIPAKSWRLQHTIVGCCCLFLACQISFFECL